MIFFPRGNGEGVSRLTGNQFLLLKSGLDAVFFLGGCYCSLSFNAWGSFQVRVM